MKSIISPEVLALFPEYRRGVVVARGINNGGEHPGLLSLLRRAEDDATHDETLVDVRAHPRIANWRQAYTSFGVNPNKFVVSIEQLCRRARKGDLVPYINTAVALFNYFSLKHVVPSGGDDLDHVDGDLRLIRATGKEPFTPFNSTEVEYPLPGEVTYVTDSIVMCRRWNWRQGDQTKLTLGTRNITVNVDCLPPVSAEEAETLTAELAGLMKEFCGGDVRYFILEAGHNEEEI